MFVSDDVIASIGTSNLDYRSMFLHFECGTICYNVQAVIDMKKDFEETLKVSQEISPDSVKNLSIAKRLYYGLLKVISTSM
jgi:cardiolipin synthase